MTGLTFWSFFETAGGNGWALVVLVVLMVLVVVVMVLVVVVMMVLMDTSILYSYNCFLHIRTPNVEYVVLLLWGFMLSVPAG